MKRDIMLWLRPNLYISRAFFLLQTKKGQWFAGSLGFLVSFKEPTNRSHPISSQTHSKTKECTNIKFMKYRLILTPNFPYKFRCSWRKWAFGVFACDGMALESIEDRSQSRLTFTREQFWSKLNFDAWVDSTINISLWHVNIWDIYHIMCRWNIHMTRI